MPTVRQIIFASIVVCALFATATAQDSSSQRSSLTITASATDERVRITAPSSVVQMHLEVFAASGEKLFDQEIKGGNVFDWHLQDGQGQRLATGAYVCVVTAKSISGKLTQKIGTVNVGEKSMNVQAAALFSAPQAQTIGPVEENSSWTIAGMDDPQTPTVIANDGTDGQMIRGRGALSFRIGNFFTGNDTEQMRLTEAGDLGIGTSEPRSKLDVAGTIRAQRFLMARPKPNGVDKTAMAKDDLTTDSNDFQPLIMGTGTQDRIAKWTDSAGTLGDSGITETAGGFVGIGTTTPDSKLVVSLNSATLPPATSIARFAAADGVQTAVFADAFGTNPLFNVRRANGTAASPSALQANQLIGVIGASGYGASAYTGTRARVGFWASENWTNTANGTYLTLNTTANGAATAGGTERMRIDSNGNVGIGTTAPGALLDVFGDINTQTQYNLAGNRLIVSNGNDGPAIYVNTFAGVRAGPLTSPGKYNSYFGSDSGSSTTGNHNSFFGFAAGNQNVGGSFNTAIGDSADVGSSNLTNATAIGFAARVDQSDSLVLGNGLFNTKIGIGTTAPLATFHVVSFLNGVSDNTADFQAPNIGPYHSHIHYGPNGDWYIRSAAGSGNVILQDTGGNVGIGTASPDQRLTVNGEADKPGGGSWATFSDERLKNIKGRFTPGLNAVMQLQPLRYEYKPDNALGLRSSGEHIGFGAQAVQKIIPEAVSKNDKGYLLVNNDPIMWTMLNAIKEQQQTIEKLQQENNKLKARNVNTETRLADVEMTVNRLAQRNRRLRRRH